MPSDDTLRSAADAAVPRGRGLQSASNCFDRGRSRHAEPPNSTRAHRLVRDHQDATARSVHGQRPRDDRHGRHELRGVAPGLRRGRSRASTAASTRRPAEEQRRVRLRTRRHGVPRSCRSSRRRRSAVLPRGGRRAACRRPSSPAALRLSMRTPRHHAAGGHGAGERRHQDASKVFSYDLSTDDPRAAACVRSRCSSHGSRAQTALQRLASAAAVPRRALRPKRAGIYCVTRDDAGVRALAADHPPTRDFGRVTASLHRPGRQHRHERHPDPAA